MTGDFAIVGGKREAVGQLASRKLGPAVEQQRAVAELEPGMTVSMVERWEVVLVVVQRSVGRSVARDSTWNRKHATITGEWLMQISWAPYIS